MPRIDRFGRRWSCCGGNIQPVYSTPAPSRGSTVEKWEEAMGVEAGSMTPAGLALAIPPIFAEYTTYQLVAHILNVSEWQVPVISHADAVADPAKAALLRQWVDGVGAEDEDAYLHTVPAARAAGQRAGRAQRAAGHRTLINSRCPPRSQIEKVMWALRILTVFSIKLTPSVLM